MATIDVKDAANTTQTLERPLPPGQAAMAASRPVVIASNQSAVPVSGTVTINAIPAGTNNIGDVDIATMPAITGAVTLSANNNNVRLNDSGGGGLTSQVRGSERALSIQVVDAAGNQITSFGGAGGSGTEYTEDAALPANPVGGALTARRRDTLTASEVSADGDAITLNANSKGQLHTIAEIPASQLGTAGPLPKADSTSVTRATDEYTKGVTSAQAVGTGETTIVAAGSGTRRNLYGLILSNTHATNVVSVTIRDSTAGTEIFRLTIPPSDMRGFTLDCGSAIRQSSVSTNWTATNSVAVTLNVTSLWIEE